MHFGATGAARRWKVRGWIGFTGVRVSNVARWQELMVEPDKPGRIIEWVELPSHIGFKGDTQANPLANARRLASSLYLLHQHGIQRFEQRGGTVLQRRKVDFSPSSDRKGGLTAKDAATLLHPLGLEVMSDCPFGSDDVSHLAADTMDTVSASSSDTASACSKYYSSE